MALIIVLQNFFKNRMHSSRMHTVRSSSRLLRGGGGGCLLPGMGGGVCSQGVVYQHALRQTLPCGQTDRCKNITFATSLRTVKIQLCGYVFISELIKGILSIVEEFSSSSSSNYYLNHNKLGCTRT